MSRKKNSEKTLLLDRLKAGAITNKNGGINIYSLDHREIQGQKREIRRYLFCEHCPGNHFQKIELTKNKDREPVVQMVCRNNDQHVGKISLAEAKKLYC